MKIVLKMCHLRIRIGVLSQSLMVSYTNFDQHCPAAIGSFTFPLLILSSFAFDFFLSGVMEILSSLHTSYLYVTGISEHFPYLLYSMFSLQGISVPRKVHSVFAFVIFKSQHRESLIFSAISQRITAFYSPQLYSHLNNEI